MNRRKIKTKETITLSMDIEVMKKARKEVDNLSALVERLLKKELKMEERK